MVYIVKESRYLLLKRQNYKQIGQVSASFPLTASHPLLSVKFLFNRLKCAKRIGKSYTPIFSYCVSVYDWPLVVNKPVLFANESILTLCCLSRPPSFERSILWPKSLMIYSYNNTLGAVGYMYW